MSKLLKLLVCGTCLLGAFLPSNLVVAAQAEDEAAVEHYHKAKRKIFDFLWGFCSGVGGAGAIILLIAETRWPELAEKLLFTISFWHFLLLYYLIQLAISAYFIYFEKREA